MARGKQTCKILKEIRRQIAEANGIELVTSKCRYKGDCLGTCPKCEAEVRYLEQQLRARSLAGKAIALAGISASTLAMLMPFSSGAQTTADIKYPSVSSIDTVISVNSEKVKGIVKCLYYYDGEIIVEGFIGGKVLNLVNGKVSYTDIDGKFEIDACKGDSLLVSGIGYVSKTITVNDLSETIKVVLEIDSSAMDRYIITAGAVRPPELPERKLDLIIVDENGKRINTSDVSVYKINIDKNGKEKVTRLSPEYIDNETALRLYWNTDWNLHDAYGFPLKEVTLRIEAIGYDTPVTVDVKYPKRNAKKTIKFKHKNKTK